MTTATEPSAETIEKIATESGFKRCKHSDYGIVGVNKNGHKYKVKTVTGRFIGQGEQRISYFYACSINHIEQLIEQRCDFMKRVYSGYYIGVKGNGQTAYYVERVY